MKPTMDKYERVPQEQAQIAVNDIRVSTRAADGSYIRRALELFNGAEKVEKQTTIYLRGIENAIPKVLIISEIVRRRIPGLH